MSEVNMKHLIQLNYKSGIQQEVWFTQFDAKVTGGNIASLEYTVHPDSKFKIVNIGLNDIESVYRLESIEC